MRPILLTRDEAAHCLAISVRHLDNLRSADHTFPQPVVMGKSVRFRLTDIDAWLDAKTAKPKRAGNRRSAVDRLRA